MDISVLQRHVTNHSWGGTYKLKFLVMYDEASAHFHLDYIICEKCSAYELMQTKQHRVLKRNNFFAELDDEIHGNHNFYIRTYMQSDWKSRKALCNWFILVRTRQRFACIQLDAWMQCGTVEPLRTSLAGPISNSPSSIHNTWLRRCTFYWTELVKLGTGIFIGGKHIIVPLVWCKTNLGSFRRFCLNSPKTTA